MGWLLASKMMVEYAGQLAEVLRQFKSGRLAAVSGFVSGKFRDENIARQYELMLRLQGGRHQVLAGPSRWLSSAGMGTALFKAHDLLVLDMAKDEAKALAQEFGQETYIHAGAGRWSQYAVNADAARAIGDRLVIYGFDDTFDLYRFYRQERKSLEDLIAKCAKKAQRDPEHWRKTAEGYRKKLTALGEHKHPRFDSVLVPGKGYWLHAGVAEEDIPKVAALADNLRSKYSHIRIEELI